MKTKLSIWVLLIPAIFILCGCMGSSDRIPEKENDDNNSSKPSLTSINPTEGPIAGGTTVTITGKGFLIAARNRSTNVTIGEKKCY